MVAGLLDQVVEPGALATEYQDAVRSEGEIGVVRRSAFVEADHPDICLFHLFEGADEVGNAGDADVLRGSGGGFGHRWGYRGAPTFRHQDAVDSGAIGSAQQCAEVMGVFNAIEREEEPMVAVCRGHKKIFDGKEGPIAQKGHNSLMCIGFRGARELIARFAGDPNAGRTGQGGDLLEAGVTTLAGDRDAVKTAGTGANGLFDGVEAKENFHH